jgi:hypothetical protein
LTSFSRLALLAGTLDGCVQLLSVRSDEASKTHKSKEWYWLDAAVDAEYCSTYRDVLTADADQSRTKKSFENTETGAEPNATCNSIPSGAKIQDASKSNSKATVSCTVLYAFDSFTRGLSLDT